MFPSAAVHRRSLSFALEIDPFAPNVSFLFYHPVFMLLLLASQILAIYVPARGSRKGAILSVPGRALRSR